MTPHIESLKEDVAKKVIMPGDPLRAKYIAETYLENVKKINDVRLNLAYTGTYKGKEVTIFSSGMGMPSIAIYATELFNFYDVEKIIRVGSCGSYFDEIKPRDIILAEKAYTFSNFSEQYDGTMINIIDSSKALNESIINQAKTSNITLRIGNINTEDVFYNHIKNKQIKENYCLAAEMECFALFLIAKKLGKEASAILTVSNNLVTNEELSSKERELTFNDAIILALESI